MNMHNFCEAIANRDQVPVASPNVSSRRNIPTYFIRALFA